jgi:hypothetical protein
MIITFKNKDEVRNVRIMSKLKKLISILGYQLIIEANKDYVLGLAIPPLHCGVTSPTIFTHKQHRVRITWLIVF